MFLRPKTHGSAVKRGEMTNRDQLISDCDRKDAIDWIEPPVSQLLVNVIAFLVCLEAFTFSSASTAEFIFLDWHRSV